jgi:uncharacterized membrane protein
MDTRLLAASVLSAALLVTAAAAQAGPAPEPTFKAEKCYGISAAGKNDCASANNNSCAGMSKKASDGKAWVYVPAGTCNKIVGGSLAPKA